MNGSHQIAALRAAAMAAVLCLASLAACDDNGPTAPDTGSFLPVTDAARLDGLWALENLFADGLPVTGLLVYSDDPTVADSRLSSFSGDLAASASDGSTGVFSVEATGTAADTASPGDVASGGQEVLGGFTLSGDGDLTVRLSAENGSALDPPRFYTGSARMLADTLLLEFRFRTPPHKAVFFLPDSMNFLARLVRR